MSALVNIRPGLQFLVQKLEPGVSPPAERRKDTEMGVILTIALVVLVVAVALWFLRRA